jgi:hypothetical protein
MTTELIPELAAIEEQVALLPIEEREQARILLACRLMRREVRAIRRALNAPAQPAEEATA